MITGFDASFGNEFAARDKLLEIANFLEKKHASSLGEAQRFLMRLCSPKSLAIQMSTGRLKSWSLFPKASKMWPGYLVCRMNCRGDCKPAVCGPRHRARQSPGRASGTRNARLAAHLAVFVA